MISSIQSSSTAAVRAPVTPEKQAFVDLTKSLRSGDLDQARESFANMVRNAPAGTTWPKGSPFAALGKALVQGDMDAARTAFASMVKGKIETPPVVKEPSSLDSVSAAAVPSSTGGDSGSLLNVVA